MRIGRNWALISSIALGMALAAPGCSCDDDTPPMDDGGTDGDVPMTDGATGDSGGGACGNGELNRPEEVCDDGNNVDGDGCSADCLSDETCGNEVVDTAVGEVCDDGNTDNGDGCRGDCGSDYSCGNGIVDTTADGAPADEACDDGNTVGGDGCSATCDSDESCGNGVVDLAAGEVCDDGNTDDGDECSGDCMTSFLCGNGMIDGAEECDDGNTDDGDGCSGACFVERCGNGRVDFGEDCDDGNMDDTDGCTNMCTFTCSADSDCDDADICNGAETCSDPGTTMSACNPPAMAAADGTACGSMMICLAGGCVMTACGDGFVDTGAGEECDDMNSTSGDGCENDCTFTCSGDSDCDDGNACNGAESCSMAGTASSSCMAGTPLMDGASCGGGRICNGGSCVTPGCGDGIVSGSEDCDDMNSTSGDGCENDCTWTCAGDSDCSDGDVCNGAEMCTSPSSLMSRCGAGTPPADGTSCGSGLICVSGGCVMARCGDGFVTGSEDCDDMNTTNGDGCDNDCSWTCTGASDCDDGDACNGTESCTMPSSLSSRCMPGSAPPDGTMCSTGMAGREICRMMSCVVSTCGDGFTDAGATPPEECDDGNTMSGDGCSSTCMMETGVMPTGFRVTNLDLISPRIVASIPFFGCRDVTQTPVAGFSVNGELDTAIQPMSSGGDYSLHLVQLFRPLAPASAVTPSELHFNPVCMEAPTPDSCGPDPMPDVVPSNANNLSAGTCYTPIASDVNASPGMTYSPTANTVGAPCFVSDEETIMVTLSGISIPLTRARVAATYMGTPTNRLVTGVVTGFLDETTAADIVLPGTLPIVGGDRLYEHLQAGNRTIMDSMGGSVSDSCNVGGGTSEDDADMDGTTRGFWFFLNFQAELITWTGP